MQRVRDLRWFTAPKLNKLLLVSLGQRGLQWSQGDSCETVINMDVDDEPPWTDLRRVSQLLPWLQALVTWIIHKKNLFIEPTTSFG